LKIKAAHLLYAILVLTALLALIIAFLPNNVLRIIIGLPFVLLFPGFTFISALYPRSSALDKVERVALSFGLSMAIVPLLLLVLNFTVWEIHLTSILVTIASFIGIFSVIALFRQWRLPEQERPSTTLRIPVFPKQTARERMLSVVLIVILVGAVGFAFYTIRQPKTPDKYTEFYITKNATKLS
jgi:uncharacterized membrane protein